MIQFLRVESMPVTMGTAIRVANMATVDRERSRKPLRLFQLDQAIRANKIKVFNWAIAHLPDGRELRVNGGHTSHLFTQGVPIPTGATALIEHYKCDTMDDAIGQISARTTNENLAVYIASQPALNGLAVRKAQDALSAVCTARWGKSFQHQSDKHERFALLLEYAQFAHWLAAIPRENGSGRDIISRQPIGLAMFRTWLLNDTSDATSFWGQVSLGVAEEDIAVHPKSGPGHLRTFLLSHDSATGGGARSNRDKGSFEDFLWYAMSAWNLWRCGEHRHILRMPTKEPGLVA